MIKAVMLRWGPLLAGAPCAPSSSSTGPFVFHPRETFILWLFFFFLKHSLLRNSESEGRQAQVCRGLTHTCHQRQEACASCWQMK